MSNIQQIWEPAIIINIRHFRQHPVEWYATINEDKAGGLYRKAQELKDVCGFKWGNNIYKIDCNGLVGAYHLHKRTDRHGEKNNLWQFIIYHDKWGNVFSESFTPDSDGMIPTAVLSRASERLERVARGYVRCHDCGAEVAYTESLGMYYDIRYCSKEHQKKHAESDKGRSK